MAGWLERLGRWLEEPPHESPPTSELESRIKAIVDERKISLETSRQLQQRQEREREAERQAKIVEIRRRSTAISQESHITRLLEGAKRGLQPLYPNAAIFEGWEPNYSWSGAMQYVFTLTWAGVYDKRPPIKPGTNDNYSYIKFVCDGFNNKLSLVQGGDDRRTEYNYHGTSERNFTPEEWSNPQVLTEAIIEAITHPVIRYYIPRDRSD